MRALNRLFGRFFRDRRGNISMLFGLTVVPLVIAVGTGVDYSLAARMKAKLQSAADAAAVASISDNSPGYLAATKMTSDGTVAAGQTDADGIFNGIMSTITGYAGLSESSTVTKTGANLKSVVTFSAQVPTTFMKIAGFSTIAVGGTSSAGGSLPLYLDFYLTLDVSGSMGLPSTDTEAQRFQKMNPDNYRQYPTGCTLACHFSQQSGPCTDSGTQGYPTNNYCIGYAISRVSPSGFESLLVSQSGTYPWKNPNANNQYQKLPSSIVTGAGTNSLGQSCSSLGNHGLPGSLTLPTSSCGGGLSAVTNCPAPGSDNCIQLRLDAVGYAANQLFITANNTEKISNQFRIGLYPYINSLDSNYFPLTSSINGSPTTPGTINYAAANLAALLDTNTDSNLGSGGTNQAAALTALNNLIISVGDGSAWNKALPYVFMVTDGAVTPQTKGVPNGSWSGSNHDTTLDNQGSLSSISSCDALKNRGITVSILYIPYQKINPVNASFANDEDDFANNNIQYIQGSLQKCASAGFFYTANTPQDITNALNAMFNHALVTAHITK